MWRLAQTNRLTVNPGPAGGAESEICSLVKTVDEGEPVLIGET